MTLLEAAEKKGIKICEDAEGNRWADGCPFVNGLETVRESKKKCGELNCWECYAREYKGPPIEETEERTPEQPGGDPEETKHRQKKAPTYPPSLFSWNITGEEHRLAKETMEEWRAGSRGYEDAMEFLNGVVALSDRLLSMIEEFEREEC